MKNAVIVISSHVARGAVGNRAAVFALEVTGHEVWAVPTITLPFHPGHGPSTRIIADGKTFGAFLDDLAASQWVDEVAAVLTGYMASAEQVRQVSAFITNLRERNPELLHLCDPVMGDNDKLYIGKETAKEIKDTLFPLANYLTPNAFELSFLTQIPVSNLTQAVAAANSLFEQSDRLEKILVTSMPGMMSGNIANLLLSNSQNILAEHKRMENPPNGPGDLTAAIFLSRLLAGNDDETALRKTTSAVFQIVAGATSRNSDELMLQTDMQSILNPNAMVHLRHVLTGANEVAKSQDGKRPVFKPSAL